MRIVKFILDRSKKIVQFTLDRLKEKSTWIGVTGLLSAVGMTLSPEQTASISTAGVAIASAILAFTKEDKPQKDAK